MLDSSPERAWIDRHGGVFLRRADLVPPDDQIAARRGRARGDGRVTRQPRTAAGPARQALLQATDDVAPVRPARRAARRQASGAACDRRPRRVQRSWRILPRTAASTSFMSSSARQRPAGTVVEHRRAAGLRLRGVGARAGLHVVGEQPRQSADALAQRSGPRSAGRGRLHSRRRHPPRVVGDAAAGREAAAVYRPPRPGLHALTSTRARASNPELTLLVAPDAPVKLFQLSLAQHVRPRPPPVRHALRRVGARRAPREDRSSMSSPPASPQRALWSRTNTLP